MPTSQASTSTFPSKEKTDATREKRIATVAWRWTRQYRFDAEYRARGFSAEEIREGDELGEAMAEEYGKNRRYYGDPAYGSWPTSAAHPIEDKVLAMLRGKLDRKPATAATGRIPEAA